MKIRLTEETIEVDPEAWARKYNVAPSDVREDVRRALRGLAQSKLTALGLTPEADVTIDPNLPVRIPCPEHGFFEVTPNNHIGNNPEQVSYGCPKCGDRKPAYSAQPRIRG